MITVIRTPAVTLDRMRWRWRRRVSEPAPVTATTSGSSGGRWAVAGPVAQFMLVGLIAVLIVGFATAIASRRIGEREAIVDVAHDRAGPGPGPGRTRGDRRPAHPGSRVRRQGQEGRRVGRHRCAARAGEDLDPRRRHRLLRRAAARGIAVRAGRGRDRGDRPGPHRSRRERSLEPENRFERGQGKLLEVYLPIRTPSGERLLFEAYFRYTPVSAAGARIWRSFAPISLGALIVLEFVQIPIAWSLARRLRERQREREALLRQALEASELERRRIAADLHDGVVQDLTGVAYSLTGAARQPNVPPETAHGARAIGRGRAHRSEGAAVAARSRSTRRTSPRSGSRRRSPTSSPAPSCAMSRRRSTRPRCTSRFPARSRACSTGARRRACATCSPTRGPARS